MFQSVYLMNDKTTKNDGKCKKNLIINKVKKEKKKNLHSNINKDYEKWFYNTIQFE